MSKQSIPRVRKNYLPKEMRVLITGCASGIGLAQTKAFLKEGHQVYGVDKSYSTEIKQLDESYPHVYKFQQLDLTDIDKIPSAVDQSIQFLGGLDVLCNTAGQLDGYRTIEETTFEEFESYFRVNVSSMFVITKAALPYLVKNKTSRIINMASIASLTAGGGGISYTASKHAVAGLTKQLAYDYSEKGLRVNAIAPGAIDTAMNHTDFEEDNGKMARWVAEQTPTKRWAQPEEVAELTLFLASDSSDYMQGNIIPLDGGWLIR